MSSYELVMLFRTSSVLIMETGTERGILFRQSEPNSRTNFARMEPRFKLVNTAHDPYRVSSFIYPSAFSQTTSIISHIRSYPQLSVFVIRLRGLTGLVLRSVWVCVFPPGAMEAFV